MADASPCLDTLTGPQAGVTAEPTGPPSAHRGSRLEL